MVWLWTTQRDLVVTDLRSDNFLTPIDSSDRLAPEEWVLSTKLTMPFSKKTSP